ncbi:MAG TPA: penicillin acylase family protein [Ignavibacteria bacterium]|nr:penicillin acylase family protein [Ignavibacteria bacterium]HMQ98692.1 penicillin acylase family protein [Ignavibacteria bacterium]
MNKYVKTFLGAIIIFIPAILILGLLFNNLSKKSFYPTSGEIAVSGLKSQVKVYFDEFGVPAIFAQNQEDAYFTEGYLHAQDRLWQMDLTRRVAQGRLSEIFGSEVIEFDKLFRTIGIHRFAYTWYENISPESKQILTSYTAGVNKFIETHYDNMPVEFDAMNYRPEPWKPEHSLMLARMMGWDLNIAWYTDYIMGEVLKKTGIEKTALIFPDTNITIYKKPEPVETDSTSINEETETPKKRKKKLETGMLENDNAKYLRQVSFLGKDFFEMNRDYREFFNINVSHTGSNSWVVSGSRSMSGKPLLANDPHLALQAPSRWYELYLKGGPLDVRGMSFPGIPGIVIGNNKFISWGLTNLMNDDNDFIILDRDSADNGKYRYNNQSVAIDSIVEKIYIKDSMETEFIVRTTKIGPVISELKFRGFADMQENPEDPYKDKLMTFRWTGFEYSDEVKCFYGINTAKNWDEFKNSLKDYCAPAQNFIYADINGNIGYRAGGKIPVRKTNSNIDYSYIFPGEGEINWTGYVEFEKMPEVYNPPEGYLITANTNPSDWIKDSNEEFYISYLWEPSSRYNSIKKFIEGKTIFDIEDFKILQNSYQSPYALDILKDLGSDTQDDHNFNDEDALWAVDKLKSWNGDLNKNDAAGLIYNTYLVFLVKNIFEDELGPNVFNDFIAIQNIPYRSLEILMKQPDNVWFDNVVTDNTESRRDIVRKSISQTVEFLKNRFPGRDKNTWQWGSVHTIKFRHPLGFVEALDKTFNIGPFDVGGDQTSINNTEYRFSDVIEKGSFDVVVGASMRMLINMADTDHPLTINSTGQSGQPVSTHYSDQSRMWSYGDYKKNVSGEPEMIDKKFDLLILNP